MLLLLGPHWKVGKAWDGVGGVGAEDSSSQSRLPGVCGQDVFTYDCVPYPDEYKAALYTHSMPYTLLILQPPVHGVPSVQEHYLCLPSGEQKARTRSLL